MIVVDTSVWIDFFNGVASQPAVKLQNLLGTRQILMGDLILCEVLQGFADERQAATARNALAAFDFAPMVGQEVALLAAAHYRSLRSRGITIRKTIDLLIGTFCIVRGHGLLHADRDYEPMARYLGLTTV